MGAKIIIFSYLFALFPLIVPADAWATFQCNSCVLLESCPELQPVVAATASNSIITQVYPFLVCDHMNLTPLVCCDPGMIDLVLGLTLRLKPISDETIDLFGNRYGILNEDFGLLPDTTENNGGLENLLGENSGSGAATSSLPYKINEPICVSNTKSRIIGGEEAQTGQFPWMAKLGFSRKVMNHKKKRPHKENYLCAGSLITRRHVLTVAHCFINLRNEFRLSKVVLDADSDQPKYFKPSVVVVHKKYNPSTKKNDIALIKLNKDVKYTETVSPICLPDLNFNLLSLKDHHLVVAGWGTTTYVGAEPASSLRYTSLIFMRQEECSRRYKDLYNISIGLKQICTAGESDRDSCAGDSGGPLFSWTKNIDGGAIAVGLVSFGPRRCATQGVPAVYTSVKHYLPWILTNIEI